MAFLKKTCSEKRESFHPFSWLAPQQEKILFFLAMAGTVCLMGILNYLDQDLKTAAAPYGIVSFEFAGDFASAENIIKQWGEPGRILAGFHLGLDYLFLFFYPVFISLGCALAARHFQSTCSVLSRIGLILSWAQIPAGLFDAIENLALLSLLQGSGATLSPGTAWWCAAIKFIIVISGLTFLLLVSILLIARYIQNSKQLK